MSKTIPILKWAGGKRQLLSSIMPLLPQNIRTYYEPFVGAGAVLLELQPKSAVINDTNTELMNVYQVIKVDPKSVIDLLKEYEVKHNKEYYYQVRSIDQDKEKYDSLSLVEKAARTIYLNRTCFNGLYRVNKDGYFNTPIGRNSHIQILNENGIMQIHTYLNSAKIKLLNGDYRKALYGIGPQDFVFIDPPYYPTNRDSFIRYDSGNFGIAEQHKLKAKCDNLNNRGIKFMETNTDCDEVKQLYAAYTIREVDVRRSINANADGRVGKELIITNY